jgi:hypothetical protein
MTDHRDGLEPMDDAEIDEGEAITELAQFVDYVSGDVIARVRRSIQGRMTLNQLASYAGTTPLIVLRSFWSLVNSFSIRE